MTTYVYKSTTGFPVNIDNYIITPNPGLYSKYQIDALDAFLGSTLSRYDDGVLATVDNELPLTATKSIGTGLLNSLSAGGTTYNLPYTDGTVNVQKYWATPAPVDETPAVQAAMTANPGGTIFFHQASHKFKTTVQVSAVGTTFSGTSGNRASSNGTELKFEPETPQPFFRLGTDDAGAWDANSYNGTGSKTTFKNLDIQMAGALRATPLAQAGNYAPGCNGIEDWRGGSINIEDCIIEGFENNFWGIQSDFNNFTRLTSLYSKYGIYAGPKCDQFTINDLYSFYCNTAVTIDRASTVVLNSPRFVICGSTTEYPVNVKQGSFSVVVNAPWCENFTGVTNQIGFFGVGIEAGYAGNTAPVGGFEVNSPLIATGIGSPGSVKYLIVLGKAARTILRLPTAGAGISLGTNLTNLTAFAAGFDHSTSGSTLHAFVCDNFAPSSVAVNLGTGSHQVYIDKQSSGAHMLTNPLGRFDIGRFGGVTGAELLRVCTENSPGQVIMQAPTYATGQSVRFKVTRSIQHASAMPSSGTWEVGDRVMNTGATELGSASSKYIVDGWRRATTGSGHVLNTDWFECRSLTGN